MSRRRRRVFAMLVCAFVPTFGGCNGCECAMRCDRVGTSPGRASFPRDGSIGLVDGNSTPSSALLARGDFCGNGVDDDGNGAIDDGCACVPGARTSCYLGGGRHAGIGVCRLGVQTCARAGSGTGWGACEASVAPDVETCGDGLDGDCDGRIDEGCSPASESAEQVCFPAAREQLGVGRCVGGTQHAAVVPAGPDGTMRFGWGACEGAIGPTDESCNRIDDDCDGAIDDIEEVCDLVDDDCDGAIDEGGLCVLATVDHDTFWSRFYPTSPSGLLTPTSPLYTLAALSGTPLTCVAGEIATEEPAGHLRCVPEPPADCPPDTRPQWDGAAWQCVPCAVLVQFGGLYDGERTCAPAPMLTCPSGETPTYVFETRTWTCAATCDNGLYDAHYYSGVLVCIPC